MIVMQNLLPEPPPTLLPTDEARAAALATAVPLGRCRDRPVAARYPARTARPGPRWPSARSTAGESSPPTRSPVPGTTVASTSSAVTAGRGIGPVPVVAPARTRASCAACTCSRGQPTRSASRTRPPAAPSFCATAIRPRPTPWPADPGSEPGADLGRGAPPRVTAVGRDPAAVCRYADHHAGPRREVGLDGADVGTARPHR